MLFLDSVTPTIAMAHQDSNPCRATAFSRKTWQNTLRFVTLGQIAPPPYLRGLRHHGFLWVRNGSRPMWFTYYSVLGHYGRVTEAWGTHSLFEITIKNELRLLTRLFQKDPNDLGNPSLVKALDDSDPSIRITRNERFDAGSETRSIDSIIITVHGRHFENPEDFHETTRQLYRFFTQPLN